MEGVDTDTKVERILSGCLGDVFVGADTGGFECLARQLLVLIGYKMAAEGEVLDRCPLTTQIVNTDLEKIRKAY